jgi:hypothetical protein
MKQPPISVLFSLLLCNWLRSGTLTVQSKACTIRLRLGLPKHTGIIRNGVWDPPMFPAREQWNAIIFSSNEQEEKEKKQTVI